MLSLLLACAHHLMLFGLILMVGRQALLLQQSPTPVLALSRLDKGVGMAAGLMLVIGICRVLWGEKGWDFYQSNPFFWAKLGTYILIGLLSVGPTIQFIRWHKQHLADSAFAPPSPEVAKAQQFILVEVVLVGLMFVFAAAMARWPF